jgi:hypothetical protein
MNLPKPDSCRHVVMHFEGKQNGVKKRAPAVAAG